MKNKFIFLLIILLFPFITVNAGVCNGQYQNESYCKFGYSYIYDYGTRFAKKSGSGGWIGYPYIPQNLASTVSGTTEYGFCLDPGLKSPTDVNYEYAREIDTSYFFDKNVYKVYQAYVNALAYDGNLNNQNRYLGYSDVALRTFSFINSDGSMCNTSSHSKDCTAIFNTNTLSKNRFKQFSDTIAPYINDKLTTVGSGFDFSYWGNSSDIEGSKTYFLKIKNMTELWDNPLTIVPTLSYDSDQEIYTFNFEVKFTNATSKYFGSSDSGLLNGDYNIGYGDAFFSYELNINDGAYTPEGNAVDYSGGGTIDKYTPDANSTRNIYLKMSKSTYDSIITLSGKVVVNLSYTTYHPMSSENVFLNYNNNRSNNSLASHQRMVVFSAFKKNAQINIDGNGSSSDVPEYNLCSQNGNEFYYGIQQIGIEEYKTKCGCPNIDKSKITDVNIRDKSDEICPTVSLEEVNSTLDNCTTESIPGYNTVTRRTVSNVNKDNTFCTLECNETIQISGMVDYYERYAGRYFELPSYPSLVADKKCVVNVEYLDWKNTYDSLLNDEISAYNKYLLDHAINNPSSTSVSCTSGTATKYTYSYLIYSYTDGSINTTNGSGMYGGCDGISKPSTNTDIKNSAILSEKQSKIIEHFENLKSCNKYLSNINSSDFYKFNSDLSFYYEQTSINKGSFWNNNKPDSINNSDDSKFDKKLKSSSLSNGNYSSYMIDSKDYNYFTITGLNVYKAGLNVSNDYSIDRSSSYEYEYYPSKYKYVDSYSGTISTKKNSLYNPISLGKVYDLDITAINKPDNNNYYLFKSLGDNNKIYEKLYDKETYGLKRRCTYGIINEIIDCDDCVDDIDVNLYYRMVDNNNIDPNGRLTDSLDNGFENWDNKKGEIVKTAIENADTYNPSNLEYQFYLDSATIKSIREYNKLVAYSSSEDVSKLNCNDAGNECTSGFIKAAMDGTSLKGEPIKKFATNNAGSNIWRYLKCDSKTKCEIEKVNRGSAEYGSLDAYISKQEALRNIFSDDDKNALLNP